MNTSTLRQQARFGADHTTINVIVCAWCKRVQKNGTWRRVLCVPQDAVSHGICPRCLERELKKLHKHEG